MNHFIVTMIIASLVGCIGLTTCPPRPRAQEFWATVAMAPVFALLAVILLGLVNGKG